jgi:hypothetical protein
MPVPKDKKRSAPWMKRNDAYGYEAGEETEQAFYENVDGEDADSENTEEGSSTDPLDDIPTQYEKLTADASEPARISWKPETPDLEITKNQKKKFIKKLRKAAQNFQQRGIPVPLFIAYRDERGALRVRESEPESPASQTDVDKLPESESPAKSLRTESLPADSSQSGDAANVSGKGGIDQHGKHNIQFGDLKLIDNAVEEVSEHGDF